MDADELQRTCQETGGLFLESSKTDVEDIVNLLSETIKSSKATLSFVRDRTTAEKTSIFVDNSLDNGDYRPEAKVSGGIAGATLASPSGKLNFLNICIWTLFTNKPILQVTSRSTCMMTAQSKLLV